MTLEWCAFINNKFDCSKNALIECPKCKTLFWIEWYPKCPCGFNLKDKKKTKEEYE